METVAKQLLLVREAENKIFDTHITEKVFDAQTLQQSGMGRRKKTVKETPELLMIQK